MVSGAHFRPEGSGHKICMTKKIQSKYTIDDVMGAVLSLEGRIVSLEHKVEQASIDTADLFQSMKKDFDRLEDKVDKLDNRLGAVEVRLDDVEVACAQNTAAIHNLDTKFTERFDRLETNVFKDLNTFGKTLLRHDRQIQQLMAA